MTNQVIGKRKGLFFIPLVIFMIFAFATQVFAATLTLKDLTPKAKIVDKVAYPKIKSEAVKAAVKVATKDMGKGMVSKAEIKVTKWAKTIEFDIKIIDTKMKNNMVYHVIMKKVGKAWVSASVKAKTKMTKNMHSTKSMSGM